MQRGRRSALAMRHAGTLTRKILPIVHFPDLATLSAAPQTEGLNGFKICASPALETVSQRVQSSHRIVCRVELDYQARLAGHPALWIVQYLAPWLCRATNRSTVASHSLPLLASYQPMRNGGWLGGLRIRCNHGVRLRAM